MDIEWTRIDRQPGDVPVPPRLATLDEPPPTAFLAGQMTTPPVGPAPRSLLATIEPLWRALCEQARPPYFLSWSWIETWLHSLPPEREMWLGVIRDAQGADVIGALFAGRSSTRRQGLVKSRTLHLNETGDLTVDDLCIEFNALLCAPDARFTLKALLDELPGSWDELYLSGLDSERFPGNAVAEPAWPYRIELRKRTPSYHVDLAAVRAAGDYLSVLSSKTRAQVRRTYRAYETDGKIVCEVGDSLASCRSIYEELVALHQAHWMTRGFPGAFATDYFRRFHSDLIRRRHASGEIQLLRVRAGARTVGCLYAFVYDGTVYQYQTGMAYDEQTGRDRRPGFLCNAEAIAVNARSPALARYDFLGGTQEYKRQLSTGERQLVWARVQKPRLRFYLERGAKEARDRWRKWRAPPAE